MHQIFATVSISSWSENVRNYNRCSTSVKTQYINDDRDVSKDSNFYVHDPLQASMSRTRFQAKENVKKKENHK